MTLTDDLRSWFGRIRWGDDSMYPVLGGDETSIAQARVGEDMVVLTDMRVVVAKGLGEESIPLAHVCKARVTFERAAGGFLSGLLLLVVAFLLGSLAAPTRDFLGEQARALDANVRQLEATEVPDAGGAAGSKPAANAKAAGQGIAKGLQRILYALQVVEKIITIAAWALGLFALGRLILTAWGRTTASIASPAGEITLSRRGRDDALLDLVKELGRRAPKDGR